MLSYLLSRTLLQNLFDLTTIERLELISGKVGFIKHPKTGVPIFVNKLMEWRLAPFLTLDRDEVNPLIQVKDRAGQTLFRSPLLEAEDSGLEFPLELDRFEWTKVNDEHYRIICIEIQPVERFITDAIQPAKDRPRTKYDPAAIARVLAGNTAIAHEVETARPISVSEGEDPVVQVALARPAQDLADTLAVLAKVLAVASCFILFVMVVTLRRIVVRQLRPLNVLAEEIGRIDSGQMNQRISAPLPEELELATDRLNDLLDHLADSIRRERAFSSDLAHEFKTPLAGIRAKIDLALSCERTAADYRQALADCMTISRELETTVESMLTLARLEEARMKPELRAIPLRDFYDRIVSDFLTRAHSRRLHLTVDIPDDTRIYCDPSLLRIVLRNLLENAVVHSGRDCDVLVRAKVVAGHQWISVVNGGSRLTQQQADQASERFWRGDTARSAIGQHCGLGLSLVQQAVDLMGGKLTIRSEQGGSFSVELRLPLEGDPATKDPSESAPNG